MSKLKQVGGVEGVLKPKLSVHESGKGEWPLRTGW